MDMDFIPDDLLKLILPCIDEPLCLIRAAAACKGWRRIITSDAFVTRFLSLHQAPVAGVYHEDTSQVTPKEPPSFVTSPVAATVNSRHFSLDFLPDGNARPWVWRILDSRGSLLLLVNRLPDEEAGSTTRHRDRQVVMCEPGTQRFERITSPCTSSGDGYNFICACILDGHSSGVSLGMSNFRVLCVLYGDSRYHAFVFTSGSGWREIIINVQMMELMQIFGLTAASLPHMLAGEIGSQRLDSMGLTAASLYWYTGRRTVVTLDRATAAVTSFVLPDIEDWDRLSLSGLQMRITDDGHDGGLRIIVSEAGGNLKVFARLHGGQGEWALEKSVNVQLPATVKRSVASHSKPWELLTTCAPLIVVSPYKAGTWRLRLDGKIATVEPVAGVPYPCELPWPPSFHACIDHDG